MTKALWERIVEMKLFSQSSDGGAIGAFANHCFDRITRRDVQQQECDDQYAEQRWNREQQPASNESRHGRLVLELAVVPVSNVTDVHRWPLKITGGTKCLTHG